MWSFRWVLFLVVVLSFARGHQPDERVVASSMSQHAGRRSTWTDLPVGIMPRFTMEQEVVFHAPIPSSQNSSSHRIDVNADFKIALAFDNHKIMVPWVVVFDSAKKRTLRKLILTFTMDDHEIISVDHQLEYGSKIATRIDPTHPSLHGFEIVYKWKEAEVEDPVFGLQVLCGTSLVAFMIIFMVIIVNAEDEEAAESNKKEKAQKATATKRTQSQ